MSEYAEQAFEAINSVIEFATAETKLIKTEDDIVFELRLLTVLKGAYLKCVLLNVKHDLILKFMENEYDFSKKMIEEFLKTNGE